jgi:hypothetical protein
MTPKLNSGEKFLNIDQTWFSDTFFQRRCWQWKGVALTRPRNAVNPRLSLFLGISSTYRTYASILQINTNSDVFRLFASKLVQLPTRQDPEWRSMMIWLLDGVKCQTCNQSRDHLMALGLRFVISSPYSFALSPVERAFSFLKAVDLNPRHPSTEKKQD